MTGANTLDEARHGDPPGIVRVDRPVRPSAWARKDQLQIVQGGGGHLCALYPNTERRADLTPLYELTAGDVAAVNASRATTAWAQRDLSRCRCDHNESCQHCFPPDFRTGGVWA